MTEQLCPERADVTTLAGVEEMPMVGSGSVRAATAIAAVASAGATPPGLSAPQSGRFHYVRNVLSLNGLWDFTYLGAVDLEGISPFADSVLTALSQNAELMPVPSAFDAMPAYAGKRGAALYRTRVRIPAGHSAEIHFGAVSIWCRVWVDGELLAEHSCGYAPFVVRVPASPPLSLSAASLISEDRELVVLVDNRFDFARVPMHEPWFDFYQHGGIVRDVALHVLPPAGSAAITNVYVTPDIPAGAWISLAFDIENLIDPDTESASEIPLALHAGIEIDGVSVQTLPIEEDAGTSRTVRLRLRVPNARQWSPESPHLHTLRVVLYREEGAGDDALTALDDFGVRFGLRSIEARDGALWLNGERLILRGFNRHEWHPSAGPCLSPLQMLGDLQHMRVMGCNFVRGAHYPQDQRFLDLCDAMGFLVWEENLGWGQREKTVASATWRQHHTTTMEAMVRASYNHPCVIMWGFLNEAGTDNAYMRPVLEASVRQLRALDSHRPVTYASMFGMTDRHFDLVDIISINTYPGWYGCEAAEQPLEAIAPTIRQIIDSIDARGFSDKPVLISEIGAEALYGWHDSHQDFFTEEYQAEYLRRACQTALTHPRCSGIALWHFSDIRTYSGGRSLMRPRTFNNKGVMDEHRRPKAAYQAVRQVFRGGEMSV